MKLIKVAAGVLNQTPIDWIGNRDNILSAVDQARQLGVSVLCLPELCITGYGCEDAFHSPGIGRTAIEMLMELAPQSQGMVVSVGLPISYAGGVFNAAALLVDGKISGMVAKQHLAGDGIHYEPRWFKAWPAGIQGIVEIGDRDYPIGDLLFDVGDVRIGFEICEDAWVGTRPGSRLGARGTDLILNPSASHFAFGKHEVRKRFVLEGSRAFHVSYVYANLVGNESGRAIYDGDAMIASGGQLLASGPRFSYQPALVTSHVINVDLTRMARAKTGSFRPEVDGDESDVIECDFEFPEVNPERSRVLVPGWQESASAKQEEFTRAVSLGLFDYVRKSHSRGFVVSLSGGCDSASVAVLVYTMVCLAELELEWDRLIQRLTPWLSPTPPKDRAGLMHQLLTTAYQATRNSGDVTRRAATDVAAAIHACHYEFDVEPLAEGYRQLIAEAIGQPLTWAQHDIALQNIQARVRSPSVWMLANLKHALLVSTSNRSEAAVGYATMDGDTSGGISPIAGIDKAFLRKWLVWMEREGPAGLDPIPALKSVNDQQPTAELRPPDQSQTDEGDLMPYEVLDAAERLAIRDKLTPIAVFKHLVVEFDQFDRKQIGTWVTRFFRLWSRNQWKRERYAPSFHLDDENLDPKTWCRFPILSGGFEWELGRLQTLLEES